MAVSLLQDRADAQTDIEKASRRAGGPGGSRRRDGLPSDGGASAPLVKEEQLLRPAVVVSQTQDDGGSASASYSDKYGLAAKIRYVFQRTLQPHEVKDIVTGRTRKKMPSVAVCCFARSDVDGVPVYAEEGGHSHGLGHVSHCSSLWVCPVCAPYIASGRGAEISSALKKAKERGYGCEWVTLTVRHSREDELAHLMELLEKSWHVMTGCRRYYKLRDELHLNSFVRRTEVTYSLENGFHPHFHCLFFFDHVLTDEEHARFSAYVADKWAWYLKKYEDTDADRSLNAHGFKVDRVDLTDEGQVRLAGYVTKIASVNGLAFELSSENTKKGRSEKSFNMFEIARLIDLDDPDWKKSWACRVWLEYYHATVGKKCFHYSSDYSKGGELVRPGFKTLFGLKEKEDEEIAEEQSEEFHQSSEVVGVLSRDAWRTVMTLPPKVQGVFAVDMANDDVSHFEDYGLVACPAFVETMDGVVSKTSWGVPLWFGVTPQSALGRWVRGSRNGFEMNDLALAGYNVEDLGEFQELQEELFEALGLPVDDEEVEADVAVSVDEDDGDEFPSAPVGPPSWLKDVGASRVETGLGFVRRLPSRDVHKVSRLIEVEDRIDETPSQSPL